MSSRRSIPGATQAGIAAALLAAWLGAAVYFSTVVARAAFAVLPSRTLSGDLVGATLPTIFVGGVVMAGVAMLLALPAPRREWYAGRFVWLLASLVAAGLCAVGQFVLTPRIDILRGSLGMALESTPASDPARAEFARLHLFSVGALGLAILLALVALVAAVRHATSARTR
ncbi:MAG TPA: DUF4149 domain-containing protein [Gemmatimonadaceae bacterium]|nr:DUF4149 domain-containing protein [Gemmatimonadaceae bacterium]